MFLHNKKNFSDSKLRWSRADPGALAGAHLLHDHVLTPADELVLGLDDGLEELEVLHVAAVRLYAVDEVLDHLLVHLVAQIRVVLEDAAHCLRLSDLNNTVHMVNASGEVGPNQNKFSISNSFGDVFSSVPHNFSKFPI